MKALVLIAGAAATILLCQASIAVAQDCRGCAAKHATIASCIDCVRRNDGDKYTPAQMRHWCSTNQPVCYQGKKKK